MAMNDGPTTGSQKSRIVGFVFLYVFFLVVSCAIPFLHGRVVNAALEATRDPILLPAPFLLLKWLSGVGETLAVIVLACAVCCCCYPRRAVVLSAGLAFLLLTFTTIYGCYAATLLSSELT